MPLNIYVPQINSLIDQGQIWRLATSSLLHANIGHLMVWFGSYILKYLIIKIACVYILKENCFLQINCYSLNSVGPTVENISGPKRFLAVYFASAIASKSL